MFKKKRSSFKIFIIVIFAILLVVYGYANLNISISSDNALMEDNTDSPVINNALTANKNITPVVVIDAGHGGYDTGAIGYKKTKEKDITLPVALYVGDILKKNGIKVIYTRNSDNISFPVNEKQNLNARTKIANSNNANIFVSIHANSSVFKFVNGVETYYGKSNNSKKLAGLIENQIVKDNKLSNRGIKTANYYVLKNTASPAVLVELGFITNSNDESKISNAKNQQMIAGSIAKGILQYFKK